MSEQQIMIRLKNGKLYLDCQTYETFFRGLNSVALVKTETSILLLPIVSDASGGFLIKTMNMKGDKVVDAVDFMRQLNLDNPAELSLPVRWDKERGGLIISSSDLPIFSGAGD
ncbi:MAG: hypothetical protein DKT66_13785 [Candidatus Melainabacteria bacterium]|nr:MAG: hypothetical protein DKT66_13785 [Candidatus Melainabacteria bacterium]